MRLTWAHLRLLLDVRPDHEAGCIDKTDQRQAMRIAQLHEAGRLVGRVGVDAPPGAAGCWPADPPAGLLCAPARCGCRRQNRRAAPAGCRIGHAAQRGAGVVHARAVFRHHVAQGPAGPALPKSSPRPGRTTGSAVPPPPPPLIVHQHVDDAVGVLHAGRAICSGLNWPRPPPSTMAGPPMPMLLWRVAMMTSLQPSSAALPAKQRPATMPTTGTWPFSRA